MILYSKETEILVNQLINDLQSTLPEKERGLATCDKASLIYNLFSSKKYNFSIKQFREVFDFLSKDYVKNNVKQ